MQQQHPIAVPHSNSANSLAWPRLSQRFVQADCTAECVIVYMMQQQEFKDSDRCGPEVVNFRLADIGDLKKSQQLWISQLFTHFQIFYFKLQDKQKYWVLVYINSYTTYTKLHMKNNRKGMSMSLTLKLSGGGKKKEVVGVRVDNNEWAEILRELWGYALYSHTVTIMKITVCTAHTKACFIKQN